MIARAVHLCREWARRPLAAADAALNRLYTWRGNPLYQSGTVVVVAFLVMLVSGIYLLLFYRIGSPYESVVRIDDQILAGRWLRAIHRYAADLAVVAAVIALRARSFLSVWARMAFLRSLRPRSDQSRIHSSLLSAAKNAARCAWCRSTTA